MTKLALTPREREIVLLIANTGAKNQAIADELYISRNTLKTHLDRIRGKTGCKTREGIIVWAWSTGEFNRFYSSSDERSYLRDPRSYLQ